MAKLPKIDIVNATKAHTASLFLFHGSGSNGLHMKEWVDMMNKEELKFPHIKILYPTAPLQPYTPSNLKLSNVWFDRIAISDTAPEATKSIDSICKTVMELMDQEASNGIANDRIVVAGFSMGGGLSLYLSYKYKLSLAGCCAMSSFLNKNSMVYQHLKENAGARIPPLLQFHGSADTTVPFSWAEDTNNSLRELGVKTEFLTLSKAHHQLTSSEIKTFKSWLLNVLPEN